MPEQHTKVSRIYRNKQENAFILDFFIKKLWKLFVVQKKVVPLHSQSSNKGCNKKNKTLGYGVMVTLQILVLSFLVRVRVSQQRDTFLTEGVFFVSTHTKTPPYPSPKGRNGDCPCLPYERMDICKEGWMLKRKSKMQLERNKNKSILNIYNII